MSSTNLLDLSPAEMAALAESLGAPPYRGRQLAQWIFVKGVTDLDAMSDLPKDFRAALAARANVELPEVERRTPSQDGSQKLVLRYGDGARVQAVLMPDGDRLTLCLSTQVGCGFRLRLLPGTMGLGAT
jgi:23S rRNA (adenine2503-C2)-methyltransferase